MKLENSTLLSPSHFNHPTNIHHRKSYNLNKTSSIGGTSQGGLLDDEYNLSNSDEGDSGALIGNRTMHTEKDNERSPLKTIELLNEGGSSQDL